MSDQWQVERVAEQAAQKAVEETLLKLGIDTRNPLSAQADFVVLREMRELMKDEGFQEDLMHLRRWRQSMESVRSKGILTLVGMVITALASLAVAGAKGWIKL